MDLRRPPTQDSGETFQWRDLIRYATLAASSHNTQPWKFRVSSQSISILPDYSRRCPVVDPDDSHLFKSLGCAAENLVHAAAAQGYSADVRFDSADDAVVITLQHDSAAEATELFHAIAKRQCVKMPYDGTALSSLELQMLEKAGNGNSVRLLMLLSDNQKESVIDFVTKGNLAQLSDRSFRRELISWIRFNPDEAIKRGDGLSGRTSGQPSLPNWLAKWILGIVLTPKGQAATDSQNIRSSAGIAVFVSSENSKAGWVETGRAFQRFGLQAAALDIRTAFINQPIEVRSLRPQFESWLGLDGEYAQLMVRFGHGPTAPFSLRRSVDDLIVD